MTNLFEHTSASWVHYSDYEWKETKDGQYYLLPTEDAIPSPYDPMKEAERIVLAAMDIGMMLFRREPEEAVRDAMRAFACKYGLLGIMTALPTTAKFIDYEKVYFPYNEIVKTESMETLDYLKLFFPFQMPDFKKKGVDSVWNADSADDKYLLPLLMTYRAAPEAMTMSFMRNYGERYDWLAAVIKEWTFMLITEYYYYDDANPADAETRDLYQKGMAAFDGNAPTYHIELREHPTIVWDFHSLMLNIKLMFSFMLTDETKPLRLCRECLKPFIAPRTNANFCSPACREKHKNKRSKQ